MANAGSALYRSPLLPVASAPRSARSSGSPGRSGDVPGPAAGSQDHLHQLRAPGRCPVDPPPGADAAVRIDEAEFHAHRLASLVDQKCAEGSEWTMEERARARGAMGAVGARAKEAVDTLAGASGGTSIYDGVPIQRIAARRARGEPCTR
nr:hypothetical protein [Salinispora arenicola]